MILDPDYKPEFTSYRDILLEMAQQRSVDTLLQTLALRISQRPHIALVCVWLLQSGETCSTCESPCLEKNRCLKLVARSANFMKTDISNDSLSRMLSERIPLGYGEVGRVAATGSPTGVFGVERQPDWLARHPWATQEGVIDFGALPLRTKKKEVLGVIGFYSRISLAQPNREATIWLRLITSHAAISLANARAFEQIEQLQKRLESENTYLKQELHEVRSFGDIIGQSPSITNVIRQIDLVAPTLASVMILGESGTGKELVAREIHNRSLRCKRPLIRVNCASIPKDLFESEFFGHVKGAFTGAVMEREGRFQAADGGTLFLDEVGEIPLELQSKLLTVLQDGQYERVGGDVTRKSDVRVISASNRDLIKEAEVGSFRQDLYYRLNVFPIRIPPLRQRREDVAPLARHFLKVSARKMNRRVPKLTETNVARLENYNWPGNVRELQNVIERAVITSQNGSLYFDLPTHTGSSTGHVFLSSPEQRNSDAGVIPESEMRRRERENIIAALEKCRWRIYGADGAAELLGLKPTTLSARIKKMRIEKPAV